MRVLRLFLSLVLLFLAGPRAGIEDASGAAVAAPDAAPGPGPLSLPAPRKHCSTRRRPVVSSRRRTMSKLRLNFGKNRLNKGKKVGQSLASTMSKKLFRSPGPDASEAGSMVLSEKLAETFSAALGVEPPRADEKIEAIMEEIEEDVEEVEEEEEAAEAEEEEPQGPE